MCRTACAPLVYLDLAAGLLHGRNRAITLDAESRMHCTTYSVVVYPLNISPGNTAL